MAFYIDIRIIYYNSSAANCLYGALLYDTRQEDLK